MIFAITALLFNKDETIKEPYKMVCKEGVSGRDLGFFLTKAELESFSKEEIKEKIKDYFERQKRTFTGIL